MRTLFGKMVATHALAIFVGILIMIFGLNAIFQYYFVEKQENQMLEQAEQIAGAYAFFAESQQSGFSGVYSEQFREYLTQIIDNAEIDSEFDIDRLIGASNIVNVLEGDFREALFQFELASLGNYMNASIFIVNEQAQLMSQNDMTVKETIPRASVEEVFEGRVVQEALGIKKIYENPVITVGYPIYLDGKVAYALFLQADVPAVTETVSDILSITIISLLITGIIAVIAIFLVMSNVTKEISRVNMRMKEIAQGNFDRRLKVTRNDELGELMGTFNQMVDELSLVEKKREEFVSNLSHDFRSPLTSINGYTQAILDGTIPPENQERYLRIVADESSRLTKMANDILDLSRMQTGAAKLELEEIKIHDFLVNELIKFEHRIDEKKVDVQVHFVNKVPIIVADRALLQRVVYNLLDNAMKFINQKGTLELKTHVQNQKLVVTIRNTGAVIRKDEQVKIWERFSKLDTSRGEVKKSSGLGLSIVKEIMRAHEEDIWIESTRDTGVSFIFTLPINAWERKPKRNEK